MSVGNEKSPLPTEEGDMDPESHQGDKRAILLSGTPFGKEGLLVRKQLHERIAEMYRSGRKKKEIARLLDVDIKTVRKITGREHWKPYKRSLAPVGVWTRGRSG